MENELLNRLGFSDKEITVYTAILRYGKISPASLAKLTKLNRTTVYSVAKELIKQGVIAEDLGGPSLLLVAKSPQALEI
jgi:sugar-specific transcriptional regulator TrmB